jgi:hypothetical protein
MTEPSTNAPDEPAGLAIGDQILLAMRLGAEAARSAGDAAICAVFTAAADELIRQRRIIAAVTGLHSPKTGYPDECAECGVYYNGDPVAWPCDTVLAVRAAVPRDPS